jgi:transcriptional regulator with XRE-family HTH domain
VNPSVSDLTSTSDAGEVAAATAEAVRAELEAAGLRLARARADETAELDRVGALTEVAIDANVRLHEIAERAGVSRQTLLNLRNAGRGSDDRRWNVDARVACALGSRPAMSEPDLVNLIARPPVDSYEVEAALARLLEEGEARSIGTGWSESKAVTYYRLSSKGAQALRRRLRQVTMPAAREWVAYVVSTPSEVTAIAASAERLLGDQEAAVIPAGTRHDMPDPEVAFRVEAATWQEAVQVAADRMREMRARIGASDASRPPVVRAFCAPIHDGTP